MVFAGVEAERRERCGIPSSKSTCTCVLHVHSQICEFPAASEDIFEILDMIKEREGGAKPVEGQHEG